MPLSWEQARGRQARGSLERGGISLEGAFSPLVRRNLTRGGVQPSSEAEPHPRGRPALERGGTSSEGAPSPRARQKFTSAVSCPSSEAEFRPSVAEPTVSIRAVGPTVGPCIILSVFKVRFRFVFAKESRVQVQPD
jgi:hypothetical protein